MNQPEDYTQDGRIYEYTSASNPQIKEIPICFHMNYLYEDKHVETCVLPFDNSKYMNISYPATSPSLLASFIKIKKNEKIDTSSLSTSQFFYVINGCGFTTIYGEQGNRQTFHWKHGDLFVVPYLDNKDSYLKHSAVEESALFWVTDEPLLRFLGVKPYVPKFNFTFFSYETLMTALTDIREKNEALELNRLGILLGNKVTEDSTKTVTHTLWSLINVLPSNTVQRPHRHNSVALDFCILANSESGGIYTLIGEELDENGWIKNPIKCSWETGSIFITPPGLWHSHHNETGEDAYVLPVQDAGLHTYLRTLNIQFSQSHS